MSVLGDGKGDPRFSLVSYENMTCGNLKSLFDGTKKFSEKEEHAIKEFLVQQNKDDDIFICHQIQF